MFSIIRATTIVALFHLTTIVSTARAQTNWTLLDAEFNEVSVSLRAINATEVSLSVGQEQRAIPIGEFVQLRRSLPDQPPADAMTVVLHDGSRLPGRAVALRGESLVWASLSAGEVSIPLQNLRAIVAPGRDIDALPPAGTEDVLRLGNGDVLRGIFADIEKTRLTIQLPGGDNVPVDLGGVAELVLADAGAREPDRSAAFRLRFQNGTSLLASAISSDDAKLTFTPVGGRKLTAPLTTITTIEHLNGPVLWLSELRPVTAEHVPYFGLSFPHRMNRSVAGKPIRAGTQTFASGIGVHSRSTLVFAIPDGVSTFRTRFAIDNDQPMANVDVRILLDDKVAFERAGVRAGALSEVVSLPLAGAKQLTLIVDFGENFDVQDRLNWIEPALLR